MHLEDVLSPPCITSAKKIVAEMKKNNITKIEIGNILTEIVLITMSMQQGDSLSSILFNLVTPDKIIKGIKDVEVG